MPHPRPLPPALGGGDFRVREALAAGVTRRRLRARDLHAPFHGIRSRDAPQDAAARARAYAQGLRPGEAISHGTALVLVGAPVPSRCVAEVHVTSVGGPERARGAGTRGHEVAAGAVRVGSVGGVPVVHPADAWCQLGATLSVRELVVLGDALLRRKRPITTLSELRSAVSRWGSRRGVLRLRAAIELVRERTDSSPESELRLDAADDGLPDPEVNGMIADDEGRFVALGDLVYRAYRTILEYDGEQHRLDDGQFAKDVNRLDDLARLGWRVIRVTKRHRGAARRAKLTRVRESLVQHGWRAGSPP